MESPQIRVFVSYSSRDADFAGRLCEALESHGIGCWIAPRDVGPGQNYAEAIIDALQGTSALVLVLSPAANESTHVLKEVERAVHKGKPIFPVRTEDVVLSKALEYFVSTSQWIDGWREPPEQTAERLAAALGVTGPISGPPAAAHRESPPSPIRRRTGLWLAAAVGVLAVLVLGSWLALRTFGAPQTGPAPKVPDGGVERPAASDQPQGITAPVATVLHEVYATERPGEPPRLAAGILSQRTAADPWRWLRDGEALSAADSFRLLVFAPAPVHLYVFQLDSRGKLEFLHPRNPSSPFSSGTNPITSGDWIRLPGPETAYHLDENTGLEHMFFVAASQPWPELEQRLITAAGDPGAGRARNDPLAQFIRGEQVGDGAEPASPAEVDPAESARQPRVIVGRSGVVAIEHWIRHVQDPQTATDP